MHQEKPLGLFADIDYRMINLIAQYLVVEDVYKFKSTDSAIKEQLNIKCLKASKDQCEMVEDNNILLYLSYDISEIFERVAAIHVSISTKDQGGSSLSDIILQELNILALGQH